MGLLWGVAFHWVDVVLFLGLYTVCAFGTTIGFHRYFTHRGFEARLPVKVALAILGCMTMQGPMTQWVTDHRKHHALSDKPGDPHSPHAELRGRRLGRGQGLRPRPRRLDVLEHGHGAGPRLRPRPLRGPADPLRSTGSTSSGSCSRFGLPFAIGYAVGGTWQAGARGPRLGRAHPDLRSTSTRPSASTRSATCSDARTTARATRRGTTGSSRCSSSARAGTTTTTRSPRRRGTGSTGCRSTSRGG